MTSRRPSRGSRRTASHCCRSRRIITTISKPRPICRPSGSPICKAHNILYERDGDAEYLQAYTRTFEDRFFFEIVERRGGYRGFGAANAPIRLAAQTPADASAGAVTGPRMRVAGSMHHQHRPIGVMHEKLGAAAEQSFVRARVAIGAEHDEIGSAVIGGIGERARCRSAPQRNDG